MQKYVKKPTLAKNLFHATAAVATAATAQKQHNRQYNKALQHITPIIGYQWASKHKITNQKTAPTGKQGLATEKKYHITYIYISIIYNNTSKKKRKNFVH